MVIMPTCRRYPSLSYSEQLLLLSLLCSDSILLQKVDSPMASNPSWIALPPNNRSHFWLEGPISNLNAVLSTSIARWLSISLKAWQRYHFSLSLVLDLQVEYVSTTVESNCITDLVNSIRVDLFQVWGIPHFHDLFSFFSWSLLVYRNEKSHNMLLL